MADELTISISATYAKGNASERSWSKTAKKIAISGNPLVANIQSIGTSEEALALGEVSGSLGWAYFENLDDTNYVEIRSATGASNDIIRVDARAAVLFRFGSDVTAPYAIANTAAVLLDYVIFPA